MNERNLDAKKSPKHTGEEHITNNLQSGPEISRFSRFFE
jgi:hypothetical protein